jgi:hypothetical protein
MSYLVDARALRPRHEEREQDFMCTSTLYNVFPKHLLEKNTNAFQAEMNSGCRMSRIVRPMAL